MAQFIATQMPIEKQTIPTGTRGILYLCKLKKTEIKVIKTLFFQSSFDAMNAYANIRNPESQIMTGKTYNELMESRKTLHELMKKPEWIEMLHKSI